jgi:hypothetical protein
VPKFRKRPVVIDAIQYTGDNGQEVLRWAKKLLSVPSDGGTEPYIASDGELHIRTLEGDHHATAGDWIIRGVKGELYPCKPDIFEATYEPDVEHMLDRGFSVEELFDVETPPGFYFSPRGLWAMEGSGETFVGTSDLRLTFIARPVLAPAGSQPSVTIAYVDGLEPSVCYPRDGAHAILLPLPGKDV